MPIQKWFSIIWWFAIDQKSTVSARELQSRYQLGSYKTAFSILKKLRSCLGQVVSNEKKLDGDVEVGAAQLSLGKDGGLVLVAVERRINGPGKIRVQYCHSSPAKTVEGFIRASIDHGSAIYLDDSCQSLPGLAKELSGEYLLATNQDGADPSYNLLKIRMGCVRELYFNYYRSSKSSGNCQGLFDEHQFKFNRRKSTASNYLFQKIIKTAVSNG